MENEVKALFVEGNKCITIWKKKMWLIIAMAILGLVLGNGLTSMTGEDEYIATSKIASYTVSGEFFISYGSLIESLNYCEQAAEMLNDDFITAERIYEMVSVATVDDVPVVAISVSDVDKDVVVRVANALAKVAVNNMNQQLKADAAMVLEEAVSAEEASNSALISILIKAGCMVLAAVATMAILGVKAVISRKIVEEEDFTCGGQLPLIGMVPLYDGENA